MASYKQVDLRKIESKGKTANLEVNEKRLISKNLVRTLKSLMRF